MGTKTRKFGVGKRENHDSSHFYNRRLYSSIDLPKPVKCDSMENQVRDDFLDKIICGDALDVLKELPKNSVHLMITSPPYNVGKEYDQDLTLGEYLDFLREIMVEIYRILVWGGRVCFNVANIGRKPYIPLHAYLIDMFEDIGFLFRGEIIWDKGDGISGSSTAWGSWMSPSNPILRDQHEYIIVMSKGSFGRCAKGKKSTISKEEFLEYTRSIWKFPPESAKRVGHPAPFPEELPHRCIQLYTFLGDVVLDPFAGSGTSCVSAARLGRHFIGIDVDERYVSIAKERVEETLNTKKITEYLRH